MPIFKSDMGEISKNAGSLQDLILGAQAKKNQIAQQGDLDAAAKEAAIGQKVRTEEGLLPVEQKKEAQKAQVGMDTIQKMKDQGMLNEGGGASAAGVSASKGYDPNRMMMQQNAEKRRVGTALIKQAQPLADTAGSLETLNQIADLTDNPNGYDQKQIAVLQARLAEGKGQRLLQSVIQDFGSKGQTVPGGIQSAYNKITGQANGTLTPDELNAIMEHTSKQAGYYEDQLNAAKDSFQMQAPVLGADQASIDAIMNSHTIKAQKYLDRLKARNQSFQNKGAGAAPGQATYHEPGMLSQAGDALSNFLKPKAQSQQQAPQQDFAAAARAELERRKQGR